MSQFRPVDSHKEHVTFRVEPDSGEPTEADTSSPGAGELDCNFRVEPAAGKGVDSPLNTVALSPKADDDVAQLASPDLGERYEVLELLGSGGMGDVWKVFDRELGETFAIKVLKPELIADETFRKRFSKEAKLASELTHANIAAIFGACEDRLGRPGIIMRYVEGESLAHLLAREGKLPSPRAISIFRQVCDALSHSHMKGIVHRDIKPSNIIISKTEAGDDFVQLVDFGIARSVYEEVTKTQALTRAVDVFGSPRYMSPEQFLGKEITAQSDIYSLACVLYEMLTGAPLFNDENPVRLVLQHLNEQPDLSEVPSGLLLLLRRCLAKEPGARPQGMDQVLALIEPLLQGAFFNEVVVLPCLLVVGITLAGCFMGLVGYPFLLLIAVILWVLLGYANSCTASRARIHTMIEYGLFVSALASLVALVIPFREFPIIGMLSFVAIPGGAIWLFLSRSALAVYERCVVKNIFLTCPKDFVKQQRLAILVFKDLDKALIALSGFGAAVVTLLNSFTIVSCADFGWVYLLDSLFWLFAKVFAVCIPVLAISINGLRLRLPPSMKMSARELLVNFVTIFSVSLLTGALLLAWLMPPGLRELERQRNLYSSAIPEKKVKAVLQEALKYPHSLFFDRAKLNAASFYAQTELNDSEKLALLNQVIDDKNLTEQRFLFLAFSDRYDLMCKKYGQMGWSHCTDDFDRSLEHLANSERTSDYLKRYFLAKFGWKSKIRGSVNAKEITDEEAKYYVSLSWRGFISGWPEPQFVYRSYQLCKQAMDNHDYVRARRALALAKVWKNDASNKSSWQEWLKALEEEIVRLESGLPSNTGNDR